MNIREHSRDDMCHDGDKLSTLEECVRNLRQVAEAEKAVVLEVVSRVQIRLTPEVRLLEAVYGRETKSMVADWATLYVLTHTPGNNLVWYINQGVAYVTENVEALITDATGLLHETIDGYLQGISWPYRDKDAEVIRLRYGFGDNPKTRREVAQELRLSYGAIRQREVTALHRLRWLSASRQLRAALTLWQDRLFQEAYSCLKNSDAPSTHKLIYSAWQSTESALSNRQSELADLETTLNSLETDLRHLLPWLCLPIEQLGLSLRVLNRLRRADIKTIGDLIFRRKRLEAVYNLGKIGLAEIEANLSEFLGQKGPLGDSGSTIQKSQGCCR